MQNSFQRLLLDFSLAGSLRSTPASLIQLFLRSTREFFGVEGAYFWRKIAPDVLVGEEANGHMAEQFRGVRLNPQESAVTTEAARSGKTVFRNDIDPSRYPMAAEYQARSLMSAPLLVAGELVGTVVFLSTSASFFNDDLAAKATILAGQLGSLLEAQRLYAAASAHASELHQLLEISSELGGSKLDEFLKRFVVRAAEFLGFGRSYIALLEGDTCQVRWVAENGEAQPLDVSFPADAAARVLGSKDVFWTDDIRQVPEADQESAARHNVRQVLTVPLLSSEGRTLGMFGVLDRLDQAGISPEDIRRARALAAPVAVALEAARNLHLAEEHGRRAEDLMAMALELNSLLRLPEFAQSFTARAAEMLGARSAALALAQHSHLEVVAVRTSETIPENSVLRRLAVALGDLMADRQEAITAGQAAELLGHVAADLQWEDVVLARLHGGDGELIGVLCLANRGRPLSAADRNLLQALAGHASVALENARLFTRMDQANRHWMEIFDAISDFIVVHDAQHRVLRVNRSMSEFIGTRPPDLIGISMRALLATTAQPGPQPCPFCRPGGEISDEFTHSVLERTYLVSTSRIHGPNNEGLQTIHVLKDITDRREAERRYRELFDNIQEGLYFTSREGRFVEVNDALVRMLGYSSREELLQVDIPSQLYFDPQGRERFRARMEETGVVRNYEETLRRKDGAPIHTLQNAFAVRDAQGGITQFRGLILDITELKNSQAELQRERDFNLKILNNTQSIILVTDTAGQVTYANRRWYESGAYNPQQWLGQPLAEMVVPGRRAALEAALQATLAGQQVDNLELPITRADGRAGQFSVNLSPMRDEQGEVNSIVVVMTDISDTALMQSKLMHAEKMAAVGQLV
ncbi:MAG: PAS domain S-box protein, partial [Chlamydiota bacterium]